jgi:ATP-dependent DNA helicase DinG
MPEAIVRIRQGVGRLIRSTSDRGVVAILDGRVLTKPYGKRFLAALPQAPRVRSHAEAARFIDTGQ